MVLYNITKETMIEVISKSRIISYKSNEIIFYQNSTPFNLYLVLSGEISLKKYSSLDLLTMIGSETNIKLTRPGDIQIFKALLSVEKADWIK